MWGVFRADPKNLTRSPYLPNCWVWSSLMVKQPNVAISLPQPIKEDDTRNKVKYTNVGRRARVAKKAALEGYAAATLNLPQPTKENYTRDIIKYTNMGVVALEPKKPYTKQSEIYECGVRR